MTHSRSTPWPAALWWCQGLAALLSWPAEAASLAYTNGDLLACVRADGGASDLVVRLGSVTEFEGLPVGTRLTLANVNPSQLAAALPTLGGISWSVRECEPHENPPARPLRLPYASTLVR